MAQSFEGYKELREQLEADGKLVPSRDPDFLEFVEDVPFQSPSAAASVVAGANRNGRAVWRVEGSGETYADWQASRVEGAGGNGDAQAN